MKDAAMDADAKKRRLPKGTSEYQAAWIVDDDFSDEDTEEVDLQSPQHRNGTSLETLEETKEWDEEMEDAEVLLLKVTD